MPYVADHPRHLRSQMEEPTAYVQTDNYRPTATQALAVWVEKRSQSASLRIKYGLMDAEGELSRLSVLKNNWDSYGADAPSAQAIDAARIMLHELAAALIRPSTVVGSAGGGVSIYFMHGNRTAYIENYNDGSQALVMYDQNGTTEVLELGIDLDRAEVSGRILRHLD
jgi:hypothetical protein